MRATRRSLPHGPLISRINRLGGRRMKRLIFGCYLIIGYARIDYTGGYFFLSSDRPPHARAALALLRCILRSDESDLLVG